MDNAAVEMVMAVVLLLVTLVFGLYSHFVVKRDEKLMLEDEPVSELDQQMQEASEIELEDNTVIDGVDMSNFPVSAKITDKVRWVRSQRSDITHTAACNIIYRWEQLQKAS